MAGRNYGQDLQVFVDKELEIAKRQVLLEIIKIAAECETYDEFRKTLYAIALCWMKEAEENGLVKPNTTAEAESKLDDNMMI